MDGYIRKFVGYTQQRGKRENYCDKFKEIYLIGNNSLIEKDLGEFWVILWLLMTSFLHLFFKIHLTAMVI